MNINFYTEDVSLPEFNQVNVRKWIASVATSFGKRVGEISYIFCNDAHILEVNLQYLKHDFYTDIITFDYTQGTKIAGDIFISLETVKSNSELFKTDYKEELHRTIIHGVLHLCGINDKGPGEREIMESYENKALALLYSEFSDTDSK